MAKINAGKVIEEIHAKYGGSYQKGAFFENPFLDFKFKERKFIATIGGFSSGEDTAVGFFSLPRKLLVCYEHPYDFYLSISGKVWTDQWICRAYPCGDPAIDKKFTIDVKDISAPPKILRDKIFLGAIKPLLEGLQFLTINNHGIRYATGKYSDQTLGHFSDLITSIGQEAKPS